MTEIEAINILEDVTMQDNGRHYGKIAPARDLAIVALQEKAERDKGCEYCNGKLSEYQHTHTTKLSLNTFGKARTLNTECDPCPPYANCCMKNIPSRSAFIINCCPNCGRKLSEPKEG
ncbi:MAG: hypothetical protein RSF40_01345 [Oscillospiraceae bacterium]